MSELPLITGMGAALVDLFADVTDAELDALGSPKASMSLVAPEASAAMQENIAVHTHRPGGSAANTIAGIAALGVATGFVGKIADDNLGRVFAEDFGRLGVAFAPQPANGLPTGHCLVLITPDAERTMHTVLGASVTTGEADLDADVLARTGLFFAEGYMWDSPSAKQAFLTAAKAVRAQGGKVAFSLADGFCVERHHADFLDLLKNHVDIVLANEAEITALCGSDAPALVAEKLAALHLIGAVTHGAKGVYVFGADQVRLIDAQLIDDVVDLTGAGDQFAAGFLTGLHKGRSLEDAARMGVIAASEVIRHIGPRPQHDIGAALKAAGLAV
jgi:sugar/nucleoside kinase (ribokinase family)